MEKRRKKENALDDTDRTIHFHCLLVYSLFRFDFINRKIDRKKLRNYLDG